MKSFTASNIGIIVLPNIDSDRVPDTADPNTLSHAHTVKLAKKKIHAHAHTGGGRKRALAVPALLLRDRCCL
jgi:hypothetical protein